MADYRDHRYAGRGEPRGLGDRGYEDQGRNPRQDFERDRDPSFGGYGRGSARDRMGSEQFRSDEFGGYGERDYRDFGRGQPGGVYEHAGSRGYRHGSGYGGFGESPGESGGGFGSGRSYAAEPGWGPGYGEQGGGYGGARGYEGHGSHPGSYGTQPGSFGSSSGPEYRQPDRFGQGRHGEESFRQAQRQHSSGMGSARYSSGQRGQGFGEAGYGQHGFGQSQYGYGGEPGQGQRRYGRGPKGYQRSDERLREDISERLMSDAYVDASDVTVNVKDGNVTLEGTVRERRMKHRIEDIVDECMGVKDIDNRIRVSHGFGDSQSETTLSIGGASGNSGGSASGSSGPAGSASGSGSSGQGG